ncbi:hypothetical protein GCM10011348_16990 [Marinobacterium nitratireducens]|uniref:Lipoprotein n=1 Tax=Marinobacterium nitratireducens TaxID=518897 RepID=A0A917ZC85_9GAMM|nr:hypothetical protein [Marinobacterium nitratireducens]GGO80406.1 hypothetical protein GCM10011348_16990 [Marinobacterium nitratireducens]
MKSITRQNPSAVWLMLLLFAVTGCSTLIGSYDKTAYQNATSIKVDSLALMDKATSPYADHREAAEQLRIELDKAYEYAHGRPKNEIVTKQWAIMKDPSRHLLGGFLVRWKEKGFLTQVFVTEAKKNVAMGFDQIIGLESGKIKPRDIQ